MLSFQMIILCFPGAFYPSQVHFILPEAHFIIPGAYIILLDSMVFVDDSDFELNPELIGFCNSDIIVIL